MKTAHQFAFFYKEFLKLNTVYSIKEESFVHRLYVVLRMQPGQQCVFFNRTQHALVQLLSLSKKYIEVRVLSVANNSAPEKKVTICLPLLKKESMHEALYGLCEVGVSHIQLVSVSTAHVKSWTQKDQEKAQKIIIAAAEQAKNFCFPLISEPILLQDMVTMYAKTSCKLFFDAQGSSFLNHNISHYQDIVCLIGPEADITQEDKLFLQKNDWQFVLLTPTILRAYQAAVIGAALCTLR